LLQASLKGDDHMKPNTSAVKTLLSVVIMSLLLSPAAVPIITPRATVRTIIGCQSQTTAMVVVTDSRGRTYLQTCGASLKSMLGYPGLYPTEDAPWQVTIIVQPASRSAGWPRICHSQITGVPLHMECAGVNPASLGVDFDMILTFDLGGMWT
jgi:hypothetical protein